MSTDFLQDENSQETKKSKYFPKLKNYDVPRGEIKMYSMEKLLLERLVVLLYLDKINASTSLNTDKKMEKFLDIMEHHNFKLYSYLMTRKRRPPENEEQLEYLRQERVAHIFLNAVFSSYTEAAMWLKKSELLLFNWETRGYTVPEVISFIADNEATFPVTTKEEKEMLEYKLKTYRQKDNVQEHENMVLYKIPFELAINVGGIREVVHHLGTCYVPEEKMKFVLPLMYEEHLNNERRMKIYETAATQGLGEERLQYLRGFLFYLYSMQIRELNKIRISMAKIDDYVSSFPPCARIIHEELWRKLHLKFNSRQQYWLFLKGIGAQASDVDDYMFNCFVQLGRMKEGDYKEHHYFLFLLFGLVGSRIDYKNPDCVSYFSTAKGKPEVNGCPFSNPGQVDIEDLDKTLTNWKIGDTDKQKILNLKKKEECSAACATYFRATHETFPRSEIINPLDFFMESRMVLKNQLEAVPEEQPVEERLGFSDETLKAPYPKFPAVFSKRLKARIRGTLATLAAEEEEQPPKNVEAIQMEKKPLVLRPDNIIPAERKRPLMMPKSSPSGTASKPQLVGHIAPDNDLAKLRPPPSQQQSVLTEAEREKIRQDMKRQALEMLKTGDISSQVKKPKILVKAEVPIDATPSHVAIDTSKNIPMDSKCIQRRTDDEPEVQTKDSEDKGLKKRKRLTGIDIVPDQHSAKLKPAPPEEKPIPTEAERANVRRDMKKPKVPVKVEVPIDATPSHMSRNTNKNIPPDSKCVQTHSNDEPKPQTKDSEDKASKKRKRLTAPPKKKPIPAETERAKLRRVMMERALEILRKRNVDMPSISEWTHMARHFDVCDDPEPQTDWTKGWKKRNKLFPALKIEEDDPDPMIKLMGRQYNKIFEKNMAKVLSSSSSEPQTSSNTSTNPGKMIRPEEDMWEDFEDIDDSEFLE